MNLILQESENGQSQLQVSKNFDVSQIFVLRIWTRFWETGRYTRRPGQGVQPIKTLQIFRYIGLNALRSRVATVRPIEMDFRRPVCKFPTKRHGID